MRKKLLAILATTSVLCVGGVFAAGCGQIEQVITPHTEHVTEHVAGQDATCVAEGWLEHDRCIYCGKTFIEGVETNATIKVDSTAHDVTHYDEVHGCTVDGIAEHDVCNLCEKILIDGKEVKEDDLVIKATNTHVWDDTGLSCKYGDAYKLLNNGEYYVIDGLNNVEFKPCVLGSYSPSTDAAQKQAYFDSLFANRMTFFTQTGSTATVTYTDSSWVIDNPNTPNANGNFTRFAYGDDYVGRFLLIYDVSVSASVTIDRFGTKVVNSTAGAISDNLNNNLAKLLGANKNEENNANRTFTPNQTYRFVYEIETTEPQQMVQIWTCLKGAAKVTISNLHCIELEEKTGKVDYKLTYFGEADKIITDKEECTHAFKQDISAYSAPCETGWVAHVHCPQCGINTVDGNEITDEQLYIPAVHNTENAEWKYDSEGHWKLCEDCGEKIGETESHISSGEATSTQAEVCTKCGYIITPMVGHTHNMTYTAAVETATCTEDAHVAYYYCADCEHYYADEQGTVDIPTSQIITQKALGHNMGALVQAAEPTCTQNGHTAYYYCDRCEKYFADDNGEDDITDTYLIVTPGHDMTHADAATATCWHDANVEYYYCGTCEKYFADNDGASELTKEQVFTATTVEHQLNANGECTNEGCPVKLTPTTFKTNDKSTGSILGTEVNPVLYANPGTWAVQGNKADIKVTFTDDKLTINVPYNKTDKNFAAFVRTIPSKDGKNAFTGKFILHFDLTVTQSFATDTTKTDLWIGYFIQGGLGDNGKYPNFATIADTKQTFAVGTTYHFAVEAELTAYNYFLQLNVRNTANSGAVVEITNPQFIYYAEKDNANEYTLKNLIFMQAQETVETAVYVHEAMLPENKSALAD